MWVINLENADNEFVIAACDNYDTICKILNFINSIEGSSLHESMTLGKPLELYYDMDFDCEGIFPEGFVNYEAEWQFEYNDKYFPEIVDEVRNLFPGLF